MRHAVLLACVRVHTFVWIALLAHDVAAAQPRSGPPAEASLEGVYTSVTEADCNIELSLLAKGRAQIDESCADESAEGKDEHKTAAATWSYEKGRVLVKHGNITEAFEYVAHLSYAEFGMKGDGPGLKPTAPISPQSSFAGFGDLWKRPLPKMGE